MNVIDAIGPQPPNQCKNIALVNVVEREGVTVDEYHTSALRSEMFAVIVAADGTLGPQFNFERLDLRSYPTVTKYVDEVVVYSKTRLPWNPQSDWILAEETGDFKSCA
jgi:hypothetical protein